MNRGLDWSTVTTLELATLTTDQQHAAALAQHGISQRAAARILGISRAAYRSRLDAATHHITTRRRHAAA